MPVRPDTSRISQFFIVLLFALGIFLHTIGIFQPFLGNFAQHQTDYATVVQRWLETGIDPEQPVMRFMALGKNRLFYGDLPVNMTLTALAVKATGLPIEWAGRGLVAIFFFLSVWPMYRLAKLITGSSSPAFWALFFYAFSPLILIYSQAYLLEMPALCLGLWGFYFFFRWVHGDKSIWLYAGAFFFSLMLSYRIYYAPLLLPLPWFFLKRYGWSFLLIKETYIAGLITIALPFAWQIYALLISRQAGDESSLSDNMRVFVTDDPVLKQNLSSPAYYLPILNTFGGKLLTPLGLLFSMLSFVLVKGEDRKRILPLLSFVVAYLLLFVIAVRKFVEFEYYFLPLIPWLALLAGVGMDSLFRRPTIGFFTKVIVVGTVLVLSFRYALPPMLKIPAEDVNVRSLAEKVRELVPPGKKVIASHGSSTSFLYYTDRDGWPFHLSDHVKAVRNREDHTGTAAVRLQRYKDQGAVAFAVTSKNELAKNPAFYLYLQTHYSLLHEDEQSVIYSLERRPA